MKSEIWKPILNYEECYEISSLGIVRNIKRKKSIKSFLRGKYYSVALSKYGKIKQFSLHRLLAEHFIDNPENKPTVNHKDGNKFNNDLSNLEWATRSEQIIHAMNILGFIPHKVVCNYTDKLKEIRRQARIGWIIPEEVKLKIANSLSKKILCLDDNIIFNSMQDAAKYAKSSKTTFHRKFHKKEKINNKFYDYTKDQ